MALIQFRKSIRLFFRFTYFHVRFILSFDITNFHFFFYLFSHSDTHLPRSNWLINFFFADVIRFLYLFFLCFTEKFCKYFSVDQKNYEKERILLQHHHHHQHITSHTIFCAIYCFVCGKTENISCFFSLLSFSVLTINLSID